MRGTLPQSRPQSCPKLPQCCRKSGDEVISYHCPTVPTTHCPPPTAPYLLIQFGIYISNWLIHFRMPYTFVAECDLELDLHQTTQISVTQSVPIKMVVTGHTKADVDTPRLDPQKLLHALFIWVDSLNLPSSGVSSHSLN